MTTRSFFAQPVVPVFSIYFGKINRIMLYIVSWDFYWSPVANRRGLIESLLCVGAWVRTCGTRDLGNRSKDFSEILHEVGG